MFPNLRSLVPSTLALAASPFRPQQTAEVGARHRSGSCAFALIALVALCTLVAPVTSWAGTGGTEFNGAYTTITAWLQGDLGRLIAASLLVVGLVMGVVRQSIMAAVPAIACGLVATVAPTIIGAVVTAVI